MGNCTMFRRLGKSNGSTLDGEKIKGKLFFETEEPLPNISSKTIPVSFSYGGAVVYNNDLYILGGNNTYKTYNYIVTRLRLKYSN